MMKSEFEELIGKEVSNKEYSEIEFVYTWHPSISETEGKKQIANLYQMFGMTVIKNMIETASIMQELDKEKRKAVQLLNSINKRIERVCKGDLVYEKCRREADQMFDLADSVKDFENCKEIMKSRYGNYTVQEVLEELGY